MANSNVIQLISVLVTCCNKIKLILVNDSRLFAELYFFIDMMTQDLGLLVEASDAALLRDAAGETGHAG